MLNRLALVIIAVTIAIAAGCGGNANNSAGPARAADPTAGNANTPKTNVEELGMLVPVPYQVDDLVWKEYPNQKRLLAVMRLTPEDAKRLIDEASAQGQPTGVAIRFEQWFPDELIAQGQMSGDSQLKGQAYPATAFFQPPYNTGTVARVEGTDFFVLDLSAK
jgi:hypothetical protein